MILNNVRHVRHLGSLWTEANSVEESSCNCKGWSGPGCSGLEEEFASRSWLCKYRRRLEPTETWNKWETVRCRPTWRSQRTRRVRPTIPICQRSAEVLCWLWSHRSNQLFGSVSQSVWTPLWCPTSTLNDNKEDNR